MPVGFVIVGQIKASQSLNMSRIDSSHAPPVTMWIVFLCLHTKKLTPTKSYRMHHHLFSNCASSTTHGMQAALSGTSFS